MPSWNARMRDELRQLPDTLQAFREGVSDLRRVANDLTGVAANLRRVSDALDAAGLQETTEMWKRSGEAFRAAVGRFEEAERGFREVNDRLIDTVSWMPGAKEVLRPFRRPRE